MESRIRASIAAAVAGSPKGAEPSASGEGERASVEIVAWRSWNLRCDLLGGYDGSYLWSTSHAFRWEGPVVHADLAPERGNTHGLYAVKVLSDAPFAQAWGEVALSGIVVEGENGYRAEVATIRSLFIGREQRALAPDGYHAGHTFEEWPSAALCKALEERYKVDVVVSEPRCPKLSDYAYTLQGTAVTFPPGVQMIHQGGQPIFYSTSTQIGQALGGLGSGLSHF